MVGPLSGGRAGLPELLARKAAQRWVELPVAPTDDPPYGSLLRKDSHWHTSTKWSRCSRIENAYAGSRGSLG
jgi:hypothetical protein